MGKNTKMKKIISCHILAYLIEDNMDQSCIHLALKEELSSTNFDLRSKFSKLFYNLEDFPLFHDFEILTPTKFLDLPVLLMRYMNNIRYALVYCNQGNFPPICRAHLPQFAYSTI